MNNPIEQVSQQAITTLSAPAQLASGAEKIGNRNGVQVAASNVTSPIPDNVEEVSMGAAKFKKFDEREVTKEDPRVDMIEAYRRIKEVEAVEQIPGVDDFSKRVANTPKRNLNRKTLQQQAENKFKDILHQYIALFEAAVKYEKIYGEEAAQEVYEAAAELKRKHEHVLRDELSNKNFTFSAIDAGLNITVDAKKHLGENPQRGALSRVRSEYYDHVKDHKTLALLYTDMVERHGTNHDNFEKAVELQLKLLGVDLNSMTLSTEEAHLRAVINDMTGLKRLVGIHDSCLEMQEQISRKPHNIKIEGHQYMSKMLEMLDKQWITDADFSELARQMGVEELPAKIFFMNKTSDLVRDIPDEIFKNPEIKQNMRDAIQEVQDTLIMEEEGGDNIADDNHGIVGEVILSGGILDDIAVPMGINIPEKEKSIIPGVIPQDSSVQTVQTEEPMEVTVSSTENDPSPATSERRATKRTAESSVDESSSKKSKTNLEEFYENDTLIAQQDVYLEKAAKLCQQKGEKYVVDSSLAALKYSLNRGSDNILASLKEIAKNENGAFAKKLEIAITPEGSGKALKLIPPGEELKGVADLKELVKTAITVLEEHFETSFKNFNFEEIEKELASLKQSISDLDSKMTSKKPGRSKGVKQFDQLEYSRKFNIRADQMADVVEASLDATEVETAAPVDQKKSLLQLDKTPVKGTADYIAAKVLGQLDGESYDATGELIKDIRLLASQPSELDKLSGYIDDVIDSKTNIPLLSGSEALIREQIQSLRDNKVPNAIDDSITGISISQKS